MTFDEAQELQVRGSYSELLRGAVSEQVAARDAGNREKEVRWTIVVVKACRYMGRTQEGLAHALHAIDTAKGLGNHVLYADAVYCHGLMLKMSRQLDWAVKEMETAFTLLPAEGAEQQKAVYLLEKAELLLEAGKPEEAHKDLVRAGAAANWLGSPRLLGWVLYLRSMTEGNIQATMDLMAALQVARMEHCPELEWQILWRLSQRAREDGRMDMEKDFTMKALEILLGLAKPLWREDVPAFWRQGVRRDFVQEGEKRFGPSFREKLVLGAAPSGDVSKWEEALGCDPSLLPSFVREKLEP